MSFKCEICDKSFTTNQHLTQHKNRKKPCQKKNQTFDKSELNDKDILEIINNQNILIEQNTLLKNNIKQLQKELINVKFKQQLSKKFIKYILDYDDVNELILDNISIWLTKAENQKNADEALSYNKRVTEFVNSLHNSSENSVISDLTISGLSSVVHSKSPSAQTDDWISNTPFQQGL
jgi:hypothetical protein